MSISLKNELGLTDEMSTYFLRAPQEYWQELGMRQKPYDDVEGEYDFIHAFFSSKDEMSNYADILLSKLSHTGMLWVSWPKLSAQADMNSDITVQDVKDTFLPLGLVDVQECSVTDTWYGLKFVWRKV